MSLFDRGISDAKRQSLELAEESRETQWKYPSFALPLFHGQVPWKLIHPFPAQSAEDKAEGDRFLNSLAKFLKETLDPNEVDRTGIIPDKVMQLGSFGCFCD